MHTKKEELAALEMLIARSDFLVVQSKGKKWVSHGIIVQILKNDKNTIRTGYTVSKKVSKSAVVRNRIKRRLRAVAADVLPFFAKKGYDYVLVGRSQTEIRSYDLLVKDLKWCLQKTGFYETKESRSEQDG